MSNEHLEQRLKRHFTEVPPPNKTVFEHTVSAVVDEAAQAHKHPGQKLLAPRFSDLIVSQVRLTKGVVWILQACIVFFSLAWIAFAGSYESSSATLENASSPLAFALASYGAASVLIAGISVAAAVYERNDSLVEISYSSHFGYRQVMLARMIVYGVGDVLALTVLIACGSTFIPLSFVQIALCSCASFFITCFVCMFLLSRLRREAGMTACLVSTVVIATLLMYSWISHFHVMQSIAGVVWLVLIVGTGIGIGLSLRSLIAKIETGFEFVSQE